MASNYAQRTKTRMVASGDEILITGISGRFPESDTVKDLEENLNKKIDLISGDTRRWNLNHPEIPQRTGKINNIHKFDASYFGFNYKEAHALDPNSRVLLEKTYEAIIDAGINPEELRNTKTGVFVGGCYAESEKTWYYDKMQVNNFGTVACSRSMLANRVSAWLDLTGPSYVVDTACSSSLYAIEHAHKSILDGHCDAAIVGCANLCMHPCISLQFFRIGVLAPDGKCKSLDMAANGYARSETVAACFLQKAKDSRRVYAQLVHAKTNCDGYKEQGISYPAGDVQKVLLHNFYEECGVPPTSVEYVEAHATGTKVGDPQEMMAIDEVFCRGRPDPLLIGCVKSNLGHAEPSSGMCAIAKVCIAYNTGFIPPNIHYNNPRPDIPALLEGRIKPITDKTSWNRGLTGVNGFGFGGANAHLLLKNFSKKKINNGMPSDDLPRLVCVSGRTEPAVSRILSDLQSRPVDVEEVRLWHAIHSKDISGHPYRGFVLLNSSSAKTVALARDVQYYASSSRPIWFVYSGLNTFTLGLISQLLKINVFNDTIQKCHKALAPKGVDLMKIMNDPNPEENLLYSLLTTVSVHIGLTDVMKAVGVKPDNIIGQGVGKLGCAYSDNILTAEQVILAALSIGMASTETPINSDPELLQYLKDVMPSLEVHGERWSSEPKSDAIVIELAPSEQTWNDSMNMVSVALTQKNFVDPIEVIFTALGKIFELGVNLELANLYPAVAFPVSLGTPMLAHLVEWQHCDDWFVPIYNTIDKTKSTERMVKLSLQDEDYEFISGHCIDGRVVVPGTSYLVLAWETLALYHGISYFEQSVVFENVSLCRLTYMPAEGAVELIISIHKKSGDFELVENGTTIAKGRISTKDNVGKNFRTVPPALDTNSDDDVMVNTKDFYKELHLRGYNYKGSFRGVLQRNVSGTKARLAWINNWVTFLDNMLQMKACGDSRALNVPVRIDRLAIDVDVHNAALAKQLSEEKYLELRAYHEMDTIRCGGAELRGIHMSAISKKLPNGIPVYEKNEFIPNYCTNKMTIEDILRADLQLVHENIQTYKFKSIELIDEEYKANKLEPLVEKVADVLADMPLVQAELVVITDDTLDLPENVTVQNNNNIAGESNTAVFIGANLLQRPDVLQQALATLKDGCFVISREITRPDPKDFPNYSIVTMLNAGNETLVLLRRKPNPKAAKFFKIVTADQTYSWINKVKEEMKEGQKLVLYSQGESVNGLLGLVNCLRREPGGETVYGIMISDPRAPEFNLELELYKEQVDKDLGLNVYMNGEWGTYRHLLLEDLKPVLTSNAYVNTTTVGDLSSLRWLEGSLKENQTQDSSKTIVHVYSSALNFRDVMTASGRVTLDAVARGRIAQECVQGIEISGRTINGSRVMGLCNKGISNLVSTESSLLWSIPDEWSFDEAVTVPVAYSTVYMALVMIGNMRRGESVLVHAGTGGVGQAAINVALHHGCEVFTTVGTPYKRAFIKRMFPQIKDSHIGNTRDTSFEDMIRRETNGKGVDLVLNSLAEDKLLASTKCLRRQGRFLEIGKYDITNNTLIKMYMFKKEISFHGVMLDYMFDDECIKLRKTLQDLMIIGIENGAVRPITYITFEKHEIERAYRYMATGKHIGKIIVKIREEDKGLVKPKSMPILAQPRYACDEDYVYVLVGGLGGFGMELADWLVLRGARKLILNSRRGISNGYQQMRLSSWKTYGVEAKISTHDITTEAGCKEMLEMANSMGTVSAIFNLAVILKDAVFTNQTPEMFQTSFGPKAQATMNLDKLTRKLCPELRDFVIFSSVSCGRGNAGQTNYGFSNSVMERICEERKRAGLPALAVQWGAIGDVGLVADMQEENIQIEIGGTLQQRISSCLQALDKFLKLDATIVSSTVVAEKKSGGSVSGNAVEVVAQILGVGDLKMVSQQAALAELGLDSIMAVEIKQTLERDFEIFLTAQEIRNLTFARLTELSAKAGTPPSSTASAPAAPGRAGLEVLIRNLGDETQASKPIIYLPSKTSVGTKIEAVDIAEDVLFLLPGIESSAAVLAPLCSNLNINTCVLQLGLDHKNEDLQHMVQRLYQIVKARLAPGAPFRLLGYSFGSLPILELAAKLESEGHEGVVICLDGSPDYLSNMTKKVLNYTSDSELQTSMILHVLGMAANSDIPDSVRDQLSSISSFEERTAYAVKLSSTLLKYSADYLASMSYVCFDRFKAILNFKPNALKLKSPIVLLRPIENAANMVCEDNYGLDKCTESTVTVHRVDGNHITILENIECAKIINNILAERSQQSRHTAINRASGN